jgi:hypothetical protein
MGNAMCNVKFPDSDVSPYLQLENIDPLWLKAVGYAGPALKVQKLRDEKEQPGVERTGEDAGLGQGDDITL